MLNKIKIALGFTSVHTLQKESNSIIDVFQKTIDELHTVNSIIDAETHKKKDLQQKLENDIVLLNTQRERNNKIVSKIDNILN